MGHKDRVLAAARCAAGYARHIVGVDLADDWTGALQDAGFRAGVPPCWLAEGFIVDPRMFENSEGSTSANPGAVGSGG